MIFPNDPIAQSIVLVSGALWLPLFLLGFVAYRKVQNELKNNRKSLQAALKLSRMAYNKAVQCYDLVSTEVDEDFEEEDFTDDGDGGDLPN